MTNVTKDTQQPLEVVSTPTPTVPKVDGGMSPRQQTENTLNYLNALYNLLQVGLFAGEHSNILIQVKAWLENQKKALGLQMAFMIAADDAVNAEKKNG